MPSLKLSNLFRRDPAAPSLRERAAELRGALTGQTRRTVMAGTMAAAVPPSVLALPAPEPAPHRDQALLNAEADCLRADAAAAAAENASTCASSAFRAALGPFPVDLLMTSWEARRFGMFPCAGAVMRLPTHLVHYEDQTNPDYGWTAKALQCAIEVAPSLFGKAGQTPHRIRRWRSLLPVATAYDAHHDALKREFRVRELRAESDAATKAKHRARARLQRIPATTVEGLAVHTRTLASTCWYDGGTPYTALLLSAAAITGVTLRQSEFDVPAWMAAWERVGGRVEWHADTEEWAFVCPPLVGASDELKQQVRVLTEERGSNSSVIYRWLEAREPDHRGARV